MFILRPFFALNPREVKGGAHTMCCKLSVTYMQQACPPRMFAQWKAFGRRGSFLCTSCQVGRANGQLASQHKACISMAAKPGSSIYALQQRSNHSIHNHPANTVTHSFKLTPGRQPRGAWRPRKSLTLLPCNYVMRQKTIPLLMWKVFKHKHQVKSGYQCRAHLYVGGQ